MKNRLIQIILFAAASVLAAATLAACGSVSAPPVDLPAPVVGRIDAGGPSDAGKTTITGQPGAIEQEAIDAGALVLAENQRLAGTQSSLWKVTDALFPSAYAQEVPFPSVCSQTGRACAQPESDGSFSVEVDAVVGDTIDVYLIYADSGAQRSSIVSVTVPAGSNVASCEETSSEGRLMDLANVGGTPFVLFEGNGTQPNTLTIGADAYSIPGCYAQSITFYPFAQDDILVAIASSSDNILWVGRWNGSQIVMGRTFVLDSSVIPQKVAFDGNSTYFLVGVYNSSTSESQVKQITVADGTEGSTYTVSSSGLMSTLALRTIGPFADTNYLGMVVNGSGGTDTRISFFETSSMGEATGPFGPYGINNDIGLPYTDPNSYITSDINFGLNPSGNVVKILIADRGNQSFYVATVEYHTSATPVTLSDSASSFGADLQPLSSGVSDEIAPSPTVTPRKFAVGVATEPMAYVLTDEAILWKLFNYPIGGSANQQQLPLSGYGITDPIAVAVDDVVESLIIGDGTLAGIVDVSSLWGTGS
jgi:hypothetical protein